MNNLRRTVMAGALSAVVLMSGIPGAAVAAPGTGAGHSPTASPATITNDTFWKDTDGNPIYSQGGGIFDFKDPRTGKLTHYWYGVHYKEAEDYAADPTKARTGDTFESVTAYSSTDLVHWKSEGDVLTKEEVSKHDVAGDPSRTTAWVGRTGVAYIRSINKYALFIQHEYGTNSTPSVSKQVLVATADSPTGPFTWNRRIDMTSRIGSSNTGDQTVFTDPDTGESYLVYSYGNGRTRMYISRIGADENGQPDLVSTTQVYSGHGREGNAMFKYKGKYYLTASDLFGWNASRIWYLEADSVTGPYTPVNSTVKMAGSESDFGHVTQTGFYYTLKGSEKETVISAGDRWADFAGNGVGYNQWTPLSFDADGTPSFNSMDSWTLDAGTGRWSVDGANNYVLNGAFEADRTRAPYTDKDGRSVPEIAGWSRTNPAAVWNDTDRSGRVGNFNLTFSSDSDYSASITQTIAPRNFSLPDGSYTLSAQVRRTGGVDSAKIYASSAAGTFSSDLSKLAPSGSWVPVRVPVTVAGGKATVGIDVDAKAGQQLQIDDISLVSAQKQWTATDAYTSGDQVVHQGSLWKASWWTRNQEPGDPNGPWQQIVTNADGDAVWTASRTFVAGDTAEYRGVLYKARWWTRNQRPGDPNGPWAAM